MFCTECGQQMADEAKFCAYCGTRRVVPRPAGDVPVAQTPPARPVEPPAVVPPPAVRSIRSTAEIMPIRVPGPAAIPPAPVQRFQSESATLPEAAKPVVTEPSGFAYDAARQPAPAPVQPEVVESNSGWQTAAPAPPDAYPQGELYRDDQRSNAGASGERVRPQPTAVESPPKVPYTAVPFADTSYAADVAPARRRISPVLIAALLVALIAIAGIVWMVRASMSASGKDASKVEITMFPLTAKVVAGKGIDVAATVTGAPTSEVTWKVEEGDDKGQIQTRGAYAKEGAISLYATFTPKAPGTYHLVATSTADPSKSATSEITATAK